MSSLETQQEDLAIPVQPVGEDQSNYDIVRAVQYGLIERVQELVEAGYDVNQMDRENVSLLHWAAINNRADIVRSVLNHLKVDLFTSCAHLCKT